MDEVCQKETEVYSSAGGWRNLSWGGCATVPKSLTCHSFRKFSEHLTFWIESLGSCWRGSLAAESQARSKWITLIITKCNGKSWKLNMRTEQGPWLVLRVIELFLPTAVVAFAEEKVTMKSLPKGVTFSHWSELSWARRAAWSEWTLALPELILMITILLRLSFDWIMASEIGRETRSEEFSELERGTGTWRRVLGVVFRWSFLGSELEYFRGYLAAKWPVSEHRRQVSKCLHFFYFVTWSQTSLANLLRFRRAVKFEWKRLTFI